MATNKKTENVGYVVVRGCIQEGAKVYLLGQPYTPPTSDLEADLVKGGIIAKSDTPLALAAMAKAKPGEGAEPADADDAKGGE